MKQKVVVKNHGPSSINFNECVGLKLEIPQKLFSFVHSNDYRLNSRNEVQNVLTNSTEREKEEVKQRIIKQCSGLVKKTLLMK